LKYIYIGTINRSGGSLLTRLFDGKEGIASYPLEWDWHLDKKLYPFYVALPGAPTFIAKYSSSINKNALKFHGLVEEKEDVIHKWGKEKSDSIGVRKNYLEKSFYQNIKTDFNYKQYIDDIKMKSLDANCLKDIYDIKHKAYFDAWKHGMNLDSISHVTWNDSNGLFLNNIDDYFNEFQGSTFIHPIRDIFGYVSSEKTRITRRFYGSRRFQRGVKMPNFFVKNFNHYDIDALIRCWNVSVTRAVLLQEKYGVNSDFIVYRYENLLTDTKNVMKYICKKNNIKFTNNLLSPTLMGQPWRGNSHQGKQTGVNSDLAHYFKKVLTKAEINKINGNCGDLINYLMNSAETPLDLTKIPKHFLYDYDYQKKYFDDKEKMSLYLAFAFSNMRKVNVVPPNIFSVIAYFYSKIVRIMHIPRMIKLNLFPGLGRQNYT
jgi:hypothetical protein